jgi:hypothetical protein
MKIFISHASEDKILMRNALLPHLDREGVPYWTDEEIEKGASLTEELRQAIAQSAACILVATEKSRTSDWCLMEAAAFWALRKRVIIFFPTGHVDKKVLPEYLRDVNCTGEGSEVAKIAKQEIGRFKPDPTPKVTDLSVLELEDMIRRAAGLSEVTEIMKNADAVLLMARGLLELARDDNSSALEAPQARLRITHKAVSLVVGQLDNLVELPRSVLFSGATDLFPITFSLNNGSESWTGFALEKREEAVRGCLALGWDEKGRCESVALLPLFPVAGAQCNVLPDIYVGKRAPNGSYSLTWSDMAVRGPASSVG